MYKIPFRHYLPLFLFIIIVFAILSRGNMPGMDPSFHRESDARDFQEIELFYKRAIPINGFDEATIYFKNIRDVEIYDSNLYVVDSDIPIIYEMDLFGKLIRKIGRRGQGPGEIVRPERICFDVKENSVIYDFGNGRIQILNSAGNNEHSFKTFKYYQDISSWNGLIYALNMDNDPKAKYIDVFDTKGNMITQFGHDPRADLNKFRDISIRTMCINDKGELYLGWEYFPWMQIYNGQGRYIKSFELRYNRYQEQGARNARTANSNDAGPLYYSLISSIDVKGDDIFCLSKFENIEILQFSKDGSLKARYWAKPELLKSAYRFLAINRNSNSLTFAIARIYPELRIEIYSTL